MLGELKDEDQKLQGQDPEQKVEDQDEPKASARANVRLWQGRVKKAKSHWAKDFDRMRENMDFVAGLQHPGQVEIRSKKYVVNLTLRAVNQGVASLYARNPQVSSKPRKKKNYRIWDGKVETIQLAIQLKQMSNQFGFPLPPDIEATLADFAQGQLREKLIRGVGETLELVCQYQMDSQQPRFKTQMKQLIRRVNVCGVGYIKVLFCRDYENELTQSETRSNLIDRAKAAREILSKIEEGKVDEESAEVERLQQLVTSMGTSSLDFENVSMKEHLIFDFPQATSIIPDPNCRSLKGFVGAHWVAEELYYSLEFVNAFFEKDIKPGSDIKMEDVDMKLFDDHLKSGEAPDPMKRKVRLWHITDLDTKSDFTICDGYKDYVQEPDTLTPVTKGFWNIVPVTFNDIEVEPGCKATIFPPSSVDMVFSAQKEWNDIRQRLSRHRRANAPKYPYPKGMISEEDLDRLADAEDQQFIPISGITPGTDINTVIKPLAVAAIDKNLYDTEPQREDTLLATGQQEANIGPAQPNVTATVGTIAEQSRMSVAASDVDGLDDSLTEVFQCGGEMCLREMSGDTVRRIAGIGAVWPEQNKENFVNEIELEVLAASSGRPNKAIEINNWEKIAPLIIQAAQMPPQMQPTAQALIRETVKRLDDRLEPSEFFPLPVPAMAPAEGQPANGGGPRREGQQQPPKRKPTQSGIPLAGG